MKKVLFVLTSHADLGNTGKKTGFWIEEFAAPYYYLIDNDVKVTISSVDGGQPPVDPMSSLSDFETPATIRYNKDNALQDLLAHTASIRRINPKEYDAIFYPGGHGPLWDLSINETSIQLIEEFNQHNKPIAAVCHAPIAFKNAKNTNGEPLVKGKKVTAFSNEEETIMELYNIVPFLVESELVKNGGIYSKAENWQDYAIEDGNLITGQNPASSVSVAKLLLKQLNTK